MSRRRTRKQAGATGIRHSAPAVGGVRTVSANLESSFWYQLKQFSIDRDIPMRALVQEALNDLFVKYGAGEGGTPELQPASASKAMVETSFEIPKHFDVLLERWMADNEWSGTEVLRKALALFEVAQEAKGQGNRLGVVSRGRQILAEIIGL